MELVPLTTKDDAVGFSPSSPVGGVVCFKTNNNNNNNKSSTPFLPSWCAVQGSRTVRRFVLLVLALLGVSLIFTKIRSDDRDNSGNLLLPSIHNATTMAFCGNSMSYYNDFPRLVELLLLRISIIHQNNQTMSRTISQPKPQTIVRLQDSCLRGGSNLASLWMDGNGMQSRFGNEHNDDVGAATVKSLLQHPPSTNGKDAADDDNRGWTAVVLQDDEQYVTGALPRNISIRALREWYLPQIVQSSSSSRQRNQQRQDNNGTMILLLQTFPYQSVRLREKMLHLGGFDDFVNAIVEGYNIYAEIIRNEFQHHLAGCRVIPMATAVLKIHNDDDNLWNLLYREDDHVHPSPHATWLQSCLTVAIVTGRPPPAYDKELGSEWRRRARHWATTEQEQTTGGNSTTSDRFLPAPTLEEAETLRQVACLLVLGSNC